MLDIESSNDVSAFIIMIYEIIKNKWVSLSINLFKI